MIKKLREKVLKYISKGHTVQETHDVFEVRITTIKEWQKLQLETGTLEKRPLNQRHKKIDPNGLNAYVLKHPDSFLREIAVFIMDNTSFHRKKGLQELAGKSGCVVTFLPSYSPDLNLIENFWARLKQNLRATLPNYYFFWDAIADYFQT